MRIHTLELLLILSLLIFTISTGMAIYHELVQDETQEDQGAEFGLAIVFSGGDSALQDDKEGLGALAT